MLDLIDYLRFAGALLAVLGLIGGLAWALKRTALGRLAGTAPGRIGVVAAAAVDGRRRLVLLRRDGIEHLVLLSPTSELLIEAGIRGAAAPPPESERARA